jgi:glycerol-3-phosphate acyltransferase PlsY
MLNPSLVIFAYLCGSIPTGVILSHLFARIDIRDYGSHNIGATNVYRNLGKKLGILTLIGDVLKGALPVYLACKLTGVDVWVSLAALAAFLGHLFPVYLKFSGGKGVATALGVFLVLAPMALMVSVLVFVIVLLFFRYVSLSSMVAAVSFPLFMYIVPHSYPPSYLITALIVGIMIISRHQENIKRILNGTESRVGSKR